MQPKTKTGSKSVSRTSNIPVKRGRGRPSSYDPKFCDELIEYCEKGGFIEGFAGKLNVHTDTFHEWRKVHPEFSDAYKKAREAQLHYLLKHSRKGAMGKTRNFQTGMMVFLLKACHGLTEMGPQEQGETDVDFDFE